MDSSKFLQLPPKGKDAPTAPWLWGFASCILDSRGGLCRQVRPARGRSPEMSQVFLSLTFVCVCVRRVIRGMLIELFAQLRGTQWWNMLALSLILYHHYCLCVRVLVFCAHIFCGHPVPMPRIILNWKCWITDVTFPGALQELLSVWRVFHLLCYWSAPPLFVERLSALGKKNRCKNDQNCSYTRRNYQPSTASYAQLLAFLRWETVMCAASRTRTLGPLPLRYAETMWAPPLSPALNKIDRL